MKYAKILNTLALLAALSIFAVIVSCSSSPTNSSDIKANVDPANAGMSMSPLNIGGPPGYEPAYVNGTTVNINAIEVKQNPTDRAQADIYEVVYPFDPASGNELSATWPLSPQCNPCDHAGDGDTPDDYHDHVLDSQPSDPGHGEYNALWRVYVIMPNYTTDATHNAAVNSALNSMLPAKSEDAVNDILATMVDGAPIAVKIDTHFYFICDVVSDNAQSH